MPTTSRSTEVAVARPSSTVVLARDGVTAPELYLVRRHAQSSFGDTYAFPGGVVEPADAGVSGFCRGLSIDEANRSLELEDGAIDYYSAAIRELFEESGVLLAGKQPDEPVDAADLTSARDALNGGTLRWDRFVADRQFVLRCDALHYFSFWITPVFFDKRYATRFFLAEMPGGQLASHCGGELTDSCWMPCVLTTCASRPRRNGRWRPWSLTTAWPRCSIGPTGVAGRVYRAYCRWSSNDRTAAVSSNTRTIVMNDPDE